METPVSWVGIQPPLFAQLFCNHNSLFKMRVVGNETIYTIDGTPVLRTVWSPKESCTLFFIAGVAVTWTWSDRFTVEEDLLKCLPKRSRSKS